MGSMTGRSDLSLPHVAWPTEPRRPVPNTQSRPREAVFVAGSLVVYLAAAVWAKQLSLPGSVLVWFPPAGVAIAALYFRPRTAPLFMLADAFSTVVIMGLGHEFGLLPLTVNSVGIVGAYMLGAATLRHFDLDPTLRSPEAVVILCGGAFAVASSAAAVVGVGVQVWVGLVDSADYFHQVALFWVGDVVGVACVTPALLLVGVSYLCGTRTPIADDEEIRPRWQILAVLAVPPLTALVLMVFPERPLAFVYLAFVPMIAVALRSGVPAAAISSLALGAVSTAGAHSVLETSADRSDFQLLLAVLTLSALVTGAVISARRDLYRSTQRISEIIEATPDLVAASDERGQITYLNPVGRALLGVGPEERPQGTAFDFMPDDLAADLMKEGMRFADRFGAWTGDNHLLRSDGLVVPVSQVLIAHQGPGDARTTYSTVCRDMTGQHELEDQLRRAALYDDTTGLPNRALLADQLARLVDVNASDHRSAVLFADLDHLRRVNETFGFAAGDDVVATVAHRLAALVRNPDLIARYGGAQFVIVLPKVSDEFDAIVFADRLLESFQQPVPIGTKQVKVTGSIGIALTGPGQDAADALRSAEIALHRAREAGGGRFALYDEGLQDRAQERIRLEADLHEVVSSGEWWLAYQPQVDLDRSEVVGVEALLRWTHPESGQISPFELIRLAEQSGAITTLGEEIFRRACRQAKNWHDQGLDLSISINVSARQLQEPGLSEVVAEVLEQTGLDADRVVIELTETVLASNEHGEVDALHRLRALGCQVAVDDFGTGYSTLAALRDLPVDTVKLDRSFTTDIDTDPKAEALAEGIIRLADSLELQVVAEGVETSAQVDSLHAMGCHLVQGYAMGRPVTPDRLADEIRRITADLRGSVSAPASLQREPR